jgi:hypothetical protein
VNKASMLARGRRWIWTTLACGHGGVNGGRRSESVGGTVILGSAGTRAERRGRLLSLARRARERGMRPVAEWALGQLVTSWANLTRDWAAQ